MTTFLTTWAVLASGLAALAIHRAIHWHKTARELRQRVLEWENYSDGVTRRMEAILAGKNPSDV